MFEFRITKYDPASRDLYGAYTRDDWTSVSDVGQTFNGTPLTRSEYQRVESAYVEGALAFLRESGICSLTVRGLEHRGSEPLLVRDGSVVSLEEAGALLSQALREDLWCKLETPGAFVHVGYDYYMYVGVSAHCPKAEALSRTLGLFIELFPSPYGKDDVA